MRVRVKVSSLLAAGEVRAVVSAGADALGFDGEPHAPLPAAEGVAACPPGVSPVLHTTRADPAAIADHARETGVNVVQLTAMLDPVVHLTLRRTAPGLRLVQLIPAEDDQAADLARAYGRLVDAVILKLLRPPLTVGDLDAAEGRSAVDWRRCRQVVQACPAPVWLAGGLGPATVGEAIEQVNPFGVDVGAGVRTGGRLDARKLSSFFHAVRTAKG